MRREGREGEWGLPPPLLVGFPPVGRGPVCRRRHARGGTESGAALALMHLTVTLQVPGSLHDMRASNMLRALLLAALALLLLADLSSLFSNTYRAGGPSLAAAAAAAAPPPDHAPHRNQKFKDLTSALKNNCLPKLICELNAAPNKDKLSAKAKSLLQLIRDTSLGSNGEASSRYHFAAHMGQLISGVDGTGCHNFYPNCPLPGSKVLSLLNKPTLV